MRPGKICENCASCYPGPFYAMCCGDYKSGLVEPETIACSDWEPKPGTWISTKDAVPNDNERVLLAGMKCTYWYHAASKTFQNDTILVQLESVNYWFRIPEEPNEPDEFEEEEDND